MASHPPQQCCTIGVKHEGEPVGEYVDIDGVNAYITYPPNTTSTSTHKKAILLLPDVMGEKALNAQLIADQYASNGYLCLLIDLFHGDPVPEPENRPSNFNLQDWRKYHDVESTDPITEKAITALRGKYGVEKLGAVGYCFGAKPLVRYLRQGKGLIDVGFVAHPSFVEGEELEKIEGALSIAAAQTDQIFPVEKRQESEAILSKLSVPWQVNLYSGVSHGFAVRGDLSDPKVKFAKEQAFLQAVHWFDQWIEADEVDSPKESRL